jgi:hypothetical protein
VAWNYLGLHRSKVWFLTKQRSRDDVLSLLVASLEMGGEAIDGPICKTADVTPQVLCLCV